jgi:hypothetical protein
VQKGDGASEDVDGVGVMPELDILQFKGVRIFRRASILTRTEQEEKGDPKHIDSGQ